MVIKMLEVLVAHCTPTKGTALSAGVDFYAREQVVIGAGDIKIVPLGVMLTEEGIREAVAKRYNNYGNPRMLDRIVEEFCKTHFIGLEIRSSGSNDKKLVIANGIGVVDFDFISKEIGLIVYNTTSEDVIVEAGEKIAQAVILRHETSMMGDFKVLKKKRTGGYGHTGK